jgi:hypothetical protein
MKPRTTLILAAILIVLAGVATLFETSKKKTRAPVGKPLFSAFSLAGADAIAISGKGNNVQLRKQGDRWVVATEGWHEAEPKLPKQILEAVDKFTTTALISTAADKHATFEVDSTGTDVRISGGSKVLADFIVGKPGPDYMSTYVRPSGQNKVYLVPSYLGSMVNRGGDTWRRTLILDLDQANITGYTTKNPKETVTVEKGADGTWKITEPTQGTAKPEAMAMVLRSLAQIRSTAFADSNLSLEQTGLAADTTSVTIRTADGSSYKVLIGGSNERNQSYTKLEDNPTVYLVPRGRWNTVFRPAGFLMAAQATPDAQPVIVGK